LNVVSQAVWGALVTGSLYGLVGVGFVLLYRASKVLSFTQGGFMLLGAYIFYGLTTSAKMPFLPAAVISAVAVAALSAVVYTVVFSRVAAREPFATSVATLGLAGVITAIVAVLFSTSAVTVPNIVGTASFHVLGAVITSADLVSIAIMVVVVGAILIVLRTTPLGLRMNAVADNPSLAVHLGVSAARIATIAWGLAGLTAALGGVAFALRISIAPAGIATLGFYAFPAIILGGLDSVGGAILGGLILAALQGFAAQVFGPNSIDLVSFGVMLIFLLVRPTGLFGKAEAVRL
jgi:branched-chain amino acid transport system permease protein